jgi:hypothetical protein
MQAFGSTDGALGAGAGLIDGVRVVAAGSTGGALVAAVGLIGGN